MGSLIAPSGGFGHGSRGLPTYRLEQWLRRAEPRRAEAALEGALEEREANPAVGELADAMQQIGELSMENELLRFRIERPQAVNSTSRPNLTPPSAPKVLCR